MASDWTFNGFQENWDPIVAESTENNFVLMKYAGKNSFDFHSTGDGGRQALEQVFLSEAEGKEFYIAMLKVVAADSKGGVESKRTKFVLVKFLGATSGVLVRGRAAAAFGAAENLFGFHLKRELDLKNDTEAIADNFSALAIGKPLYDAAGAHKVTEVRLGAGEVITEDQINANLANINA